MFTENKYFGLDPNVKNTRSGNLTLMSNMTGIDCQFDLIIVSHTLEHLVDFEIMDKLRAMLKPSGLFFVEVPDASRYDRYDRKEFMYQLDRLHVNHFSLASLEKLLEKRGLKRVSSGSNDFEYKDGELYPAIYMVAEVNSGEIEWPRIQSELGLDAHLRRYYLSEVAKAKKVQNRIGNGPIVIYGFGDNFFRSSGHNGPLERADIVAVVDKNHAVLKASSYASQYTFLSIEESLPLAGKHPFVITVSWGALTIEKQLKEMGVVDTILI